MTETKEFKYDYGLLAVHGICGNPRIFSIFVPDSCQGVLVEKLILDGHGGDALDFSRTSMNRWKKQVTDAVARMSRVCRKVLIVGHSMGCLLALEEAYSGMIAGAYLLCPPLKVRITAASLVNPVKVMIGKYRHDPLLSAAKDAYGIADDYNLFHYYGWVPRYMELFSEISRIRGLLKSKEIDCPVRIVLCGKDEVVSPASKDYVPAGSNFNVSLLPDSTHYYFIPADKEFLLQDFRQFLKSILS